MQRSYDVWRDFQTNVVTGKVGDWKLALWINHVKNPRFRILNLPEIDTVVTLPKSFALANVAIRLLHQTVNPLYRSKNSFMPLVSICLPTIHRSQCVDYLLGWHHPFEADKFKQKYMRLCVQDHSLSVFLSLLVSVSFMVFTGLTATSWHRMWCRVECLWLMFSAYHLKPKLWRPGPLKTVTLKFFLFLSSCTLLTSSFGSPLPCMFDCY